MITPALEAALVEASFPAGYYRLCDSHPARALPRCPCPQAEIVAALADIGTIRKARGPGRLFTMRPAALREDSELSFLVYRSGTMLELYFGFTEASVRSGSNFAVLARAAAAASGALEPTPAYPRPSFYSLYELRTVVVGAVELALGVASRLPFDRDA